MHSLKHKKNRFFQLVIYTFIVALSIDLLFGFVRCPEQTFIHGKIIDFVTKMPLEGAEVIIKSDRTVESKTIYTDEEGEYNVTIEGGGYYYVTVWFPSLNILYTPAERYEYFERGKSYTFDFHLFQGAMVNVKGDCYFLEDPNPPFAYRFTVLNAETGSILSLDQYSPYYGDWGINSRLGTSNRLIIVPAQFNVSFFIEALGRGVYQSFKIEESIQLQNGEHIELDITSKSLAENLVMLSDLIKKTNSSLIYLKNRGFYLRAEEEDLKVAITWLENSKSELYEGKYVECYADMRQSYLITTNISEKLKLMQIDSGNSTFFITFFTLIVSVIFSHFIFEKESLKKIFSIIFYGALLIVMFFVYPGYNLIDPLIFLIQVFLMMLAVFIVMESLKYIFRERGKEERISIKEAAGITFSMAKRNLKRRKLDCIIIIASLTILISSFIDLTSISTGYGLSVYKNPQVFSYNEGIFIRPHLGGNPLSFIPLSREFISSLSQYSEYISVIAPKSENQPVRIDKSLGLLMDPRSGNNITILGVLGILPEEELKATRLNETVKFGRYLRNSDTDALLISVQAARTLNASGTLKLGDMLCLALYQDAEEKLFNFTLVGLFDDNYIANLNDMNGDKILPKAIFPIPGGWTLRSCGSDKIVIVNYKTVSDWPFMVTSRVNVLCKRREYILPLARQIVLTTPYSAWVTVEGQSYILYIGRYIESENANLSVLLILVILNIASIMLSAFEKRKNEMLTLATLGLNPTYITMIFIAEAAISGLLSGGLGYFFGILGYKIMFLSQSSPSFEIKLSFGWCILSLSLAITVSIISAVLPALKMSRVVTPSLTGRWKPDKKHLMGEYWVADMPIRIIEYELKDFITFIYNKMKETENNKVRGVRNLILKEVETTEGFGYDFRFIFVSGEIASQPVRTDNLLEIRKGGNYYIARLKCKPFVGVIGAKSDFQFRETSLFVRNILLLWEGSGYTIAAPFYGSESNLISLIEYYQPRIINLILQKGEEEKINNLINFLKYKKMKVSFFKLFPVDANNFEECEKRAKSAVEDAKIVCITGGTETMNKALLLEAMKRNKKVCYYVGVESKDLQFIELEPKESSRIK
jgi:ABC-type lipoprotein release transport system permease subunit